MTFKNLTRVIISEGIYEVEKYGVRVKEIRIGSELHNDFLKLFPDYLEQLKTNILDEKNLDNLMMFGSAKIEFVLYNKETYYMKPNEILFLSDDDSVFCRMKKEK